MSEEKKMTLEEGFARLDEILDQLENPEITLEESFKLYQKGVEILGTCNETIDQVEKKVLVLSEDGKLDAL